MTQSDYSPALEPRDHVEVLQRLASSDGDSSSALPSVDDALLQTPSVKALYDALEGLYKAGITASKEDYQTSFQALVLALEDLDHRLGEHRYLSEQSEPDLGDWWLFAALIRFDVVYYGLYKANHRRIAEYPHLSHYLRDLFQRPGVAGTVDFPAIKEHYYRQSELLNPKRLVPKGGVPRLHARHDRAERFAAAPDASATEESQTASRAKGEWVRPQSAHRSWITTDGSSAYPAEAGRYHLYIANNCPWCHRVALTRSIKGLQDVISMDVLYYRRDPERGWQFKPEVDGCTPDTVNGVRYIQELYERVGSTEKSVPLLWDKQTQSIVNNESAEIIRMLNAFDGAHGDSLDLYPAQHQVEIDRYNAWIYNAINNGAYKAGFANSQQAYEQAYDALFTAFDELDAIFAERQFLCGATLTEADVRLFPTIFRFDPVYYTRFRLNETMVRDLPHLHRWLNDVYRYPGVAEASNLEHCKQGYFGRTGNHIVPIGPMNASVPVDRPDAIA